jgi:MFS family permease
MVLLADARGLALATIGIVFLAYTLTCAVLELPTGALADVVGRRAVLLASGVLFVASAVVTAAAQTPEAFVAGAVLGGMARALDSGPLEAWFVDTARVADPGCDLKPGLSDAGVAGSLGIGLGSLATGAAIALLPAGEISYVVAYLASAGVGLVGLALVIAWVREPVPLGERPSLRAVLADVPRTAARGAALAARGPVLRRLSLRAVVVGIVLVTCELLSPLMFAASIGADGYAVLLTLAFGGAALGARRGPALARVAGGSGRGLLVATTLAGTALCGLALPGPWWPAEAYVLVYVALGLDDPLVGELLHEETSAAERSTVLSVQSLLQKGGGAGANVALPLLVVGTSFDAAWLAVGSVFVLTALLAVGLPQVTRVGERFS